MATNVTINISNLGEKMDTLLEEGIAKKKGKIININLRDLGIDKLLGNGSIKLRLNIIVPLASKTAINKIEAAGGKVDLSK